MPASQERAPVHTDWLRNTLTVSGPVEAMASFREAAAGSGVIPWRYDLERMQEDWFLGLAAPPDGERAISLQGARILAWRLRDAVAVNQQRAMARMATDRRCPFDLHRLLPIPPLILELGPDEPEAQAWLRAHWGTTRGLRHVRELPAAGDRRRRRMGEMRVEFWSADWSPWQALLRLRHASPSLTFDLVPDYASAGDA
ncbi:hypothetical protein GXW71_08335 [Roseomonas hellenica]|uniref:Uncharacterized protein n=1 Tax=Plastoroseomonas hellenica TaxID=2687306 RepID=A0ABS5EVP1_9PROT|nr:hypothetical protein [Plastoroseomonas hellenica]MBR0664362.1 hypothetical protein [Plastoroseomonas hellenica]